MKVGQMKINFDRKKYMEMKWTLRKSLKNQQREVYHETSTPLPQHSPWEGGELQEFSDILGGREWQSATGKLWVFTVDCQRD